MLKTISTDFYLISPPPGAAHKPVPASKLVFAGDSAGGALCVTALTVIRDMGLPMPAGAVLISPWVDMTHSFPSVMDNTHSVSFLFASDLLPHSDYTPDHDGISCNSLSLSCLVIVGYHSSTRFRSQTVHDLACPYPAGQIWSYSRHANTNQPTSTSRSRRQT